MREIKFRAWDGYKMYSPTIEGSCDVSEYLNSCDTLMEFTGLLDKNGKPIYEGDIVKLEFWEPSIFQIAFNRGAFYLADKKLKEVGDIKYAEKSEIIGNIYESPNLLN